MRFPGEGVELQEIADWLNSNDFKTPRGHKFLNAHAISIVNKEAFERCEIDEKIPPKVLRFRNLVRR